MSSSYHLRYHGLPTELLDSIAHYSLYVPEGIIINSQLSRPPAAAAAAAPKDSRQCLCNSRSDTAAFGLLFASYKLHAIAQRLVYSKNEFVVNLAPAEALRFLQSLARTSRRLIARLTFGVVFSSTPQWWMQFCYDWGQWRWDRPSNACFNYSSPHAAVAIDTLRQVCVYLLAETGVRRVGWMRSMNSGYMPNMLHPDIGLLGALEHGILQMVEIQVCLDAPGGMEDSRPLGWTDWKSGRYGSRFCLATSWVMEDAAKVMFAKGTDTTMLSGMPFRQRDEDTIESFITMLNAWNAKGYDWSVEGRREGWWAVLTKGKNANASEVSL